MNSDYVHISDTQTNLKQDAISEGTMLKDTVFDEIDKVMKHSIDIQNQAKDFMDVLGSKSYHHYNDLFLIDQSTLNTIDPAVSDETVKQKQTLALKSIGNYLTNLDTIAQKFTMEKMLVIEQKVSEFHGLGQTSEKYLQLSFDLKHLHDNVISLKNKTVPQQIQDECQSVINKIKQVGGTLKAKGAYFELLDHQQQFEQLSLEMETLNEHDENSCKNYNRLNYLLDEELRLFSDIEQGNLIMGIVILLGTAQSVVKSPVRAFTQQFQ